MKKPLLAVAVLVVAGVTAPAGQAPDQVQPAPPFRASVALVRVDVSVTGRDDEAVADLQVADFEVEEDGVRQKIETLQLVTLNGTRTSGVNDSLDIRSQEHAAAEAARDDVRVFAIFLDDYHVDRNPEVASRAKGALKDFLKQLGSNDLVTIMDPLTPLSALRFTRDRDELRLRIDRFEGRRGQFSPARNAAEAEHLGSGNPGELRAGVTISALNALVTHLGGLREGRKSVVLVSQGPPTGFAGQNDKTLRDVLQAANRGNVTIHTYNPRIGIAGRGGRSTLETLQHETGGRAFFDSSDEELSQVIADASTYYLVGYAPMRGFSDGKFHRIEVKVSRRGARVLARNGYWAPTEKEMNPAAPPPVEPGLVEALATLATPRGGRAADVWMGASRGPDSLTRLTVSWDPAETAGASRPMRVTVELLNSKTQDPIGDAHSISSASAANATTAATTAATFDLQPGASFSLRFVALGPDGVVLDRWTQPFTVPAVRGDGGEDGVALGTPRVFRAQSAFEARALATGTGRAPSATRRFRQTDRVFVDLECYARDGATPVVAAQLLNGEGKKVADLPVPPVSEDKVRITLPVSSLAPSTYVLRLEVRAGEHVVFERLAFQVTR